MGDGTLAPGLVLRGIVAEVRWGHARAARLEGYRVMRSKEGQWSASGRAVLVDRFNIRQKDLRFVAPHQGGCWYWPVIDLTMHGETLTATLGPPVE